MGDVGPRAKHAQHSRPTAMEDLDARSADDSAGAGAPVLDGAGTQRNDFRAYLATLEQEILVREAAMDSGQRFL